jgi:hypothetical protein
MRRYAYIHNTQKIFTHTRLSGSRSTKSSARSSIRLHTYKLYHLSNKYADGRENREAACQNIANANTADNMEHDLSRNTSVSFSFLPNTTPQQTRTPVCKGRERQKQQCYIRSIYACAMPRARHQKRGQS